MLVCPYCKDRMEGGAESVRCVQCNTKHHRICWLENDCHCSVFQCAQKYSSARFRPGSYAGRDARATTVKWMLLVPLFCILNITLHLFINSFAPAVSYFRVPDAVIVLILEAFILITGALLMFLFRRRIRPVWRAVSTLLLSGDALYVLWMAGYFFRYGSDALFGTIWL